MNENLALISDTVLAIHEHIQTTWEPVVPSEDEEVEFRTPTKRKRSSTARDMAALRDGISEDSDLSSAEDNETVDAKKDRVKRSKAKTKRNEARQIRRDKRALETAELKPGPLRPSMLTDAAYEAHWRQACAGAMGGDALERFEILKTDILVDYNSKYYDHTVMQVKTEKELEALHDHIVAGVLRTINRQIVTLFHDCCVREKDATKEQDALRSILCTTEMKEVMLGRRCDLLWLLKPWLMPAVRVYVQLMHYYESLTDSTNVNLMTEMSRVLVDTNKASVYMAREDFDKVLDPLAKNFTSVPTLLQFLKDCFAAHAIRQRGEDAGSGGRAWRKAADFLRDSCKDGTRLDTSMVEEAMQLAEAHLRDKPAGEVVKSQAATTESAPPLTPGAAAKKLKKTLKNSEKQIKALEARLAEPSSGAGGGKPSFTP